MNIWINGNEFIRLCLEDIYFVNARFPLKFSIFLMAAGEIVN